ncbi:MAG: sigma-70 family RNA polymerase sigma factor [Burkholderiales bacterium]|nr:sigma-70 family RNA polymerase sigma factor [Burkholderiales bacterium]
MNRSCGAAAKLPEGERKVLAVRALAGSESITELATEHGVSRKFVYEQTHRANVALDAAFPTASNDA